MKKIIITSIALIMVFGLVFAANEVMAKEEECPAAPEVASQLLEEADINARYGKGRDGGNYVSDVARNMGPKTNFEGVDKCEKDAYKLKVAEFLFDKGAEDVADLFKTELESVEYEGMCSAFGTQEGDVITFTFSDEIEKEGDIITNFDGYQDFKESWGKADYEVKENLLTVTITEKWGNPRPEVGASVVGTENIKDVFGDDVVVPEGGVEVKGEPEGIGVIEPDNSSASFTDNENGAGTMDITVKDYCGNGIEELDMDDITVIPPSGTEASLTQLNNYNSWNVSLSENKKGSYSVSLDYNNPPYDKGWDIKVKDKTIEKDLEIGITK